MRILIFQILSLTFFYSCNKARPATYYLPEKFEGFIAVVYSQKQGTGEVRNGRRQFYIPANGILLTSADFSGGWRDDIFLVKTEKGYDTLKMYYPLADSLKDKSNMLPAMHTANNNEVAVNMRQLINSVPPNGENKPCRFTYEIVTIGRAATLTDSAGLLFKERLNKYLDDTLCRINVSKQ